MRFLNEFIFKTFDEAFDVHKKIYELGRKNGFVSYGAVYMLVTKEPQVIAMPKIYQINGWTNLTESKVVQCADGLWKMVLPPVQNIENRINLNKKGE